MGIVIDMREDFEYIRAMNDRLRDQGLQSWDWAEDSETLEIADS